MSVSSGFRGIKQLQIVDSENMYCMLLRISLNAVELCRQHYLSNIAL